MITCINLSEFDEILHNSRRIDDTDKVDLLKDFKEMGIESIWMVNEKEKPIPLAVRTKKGKIIYLQMKDYLLSLDQSLTQTANHDHNYVLVEKFMGLIESLTATKKELLKQREL